MIFIYNDYGGTHTTSLAAAYHLNRLPTDRQLTSEEILHVDYFNKLTRADFCKFIFHGIDEDGNAVYTIGRGHKSTKLMVPALKNLCSLLQERYDRTEKIIFSNTSHTVPFAMTMGGLFSRGLKIDFIGVPLLLIGAKQCCKKILDLVENTKQVAKSSNEMVVVLENENFK